MDKVADLLIRIKNGYLASNKEVSANYSKLALSICQLLKKEGFLEDVKKDDKSLMILLKYNNKTPSVTDIKRVSKPGRRVYVGGKFLPRVLDGGGVAIISTPQGIMTDHQARKEHIGGEVMAYIW